MPTEMRHIIFELTEAVQAVQMYHVHMGTPLPAGSVVRSNVECDKGSKLVRFRVTVQPDLVEVKGETVQPPERNVSLEGTSLAAALLIFCRKQGIPMSAKADKTLEVYGKKLCLIATLPLAAPRP